MVLDDIFERFAERSPVTVMARAALEHAPAPRAVDAIFEAAAERQYSRTLLFSTVVNLVASAVSNIRPAIHSALQANAESIGVSLRAVYDKIDRTEPGVSAELVRHAARILSPVIKAMNGELRPRLPGYPIRILDGNHLAGTRHRLKELRTIGAVGLPGHALVVLDPQAMPVTDVLPCQDGHARERSLPDQVPGTIRSGEVWVADRNFCTTGFIFGIARRGGHFVIRRHQSTLHFELVSERRACGGADTGTVSGQEARLSDDDGGPMRVRRITVVLDVPTRDGEAEIYILTGLPAEAAEALKIAELYRNRWTVESGFGELATCLNGEINTLGYPKEALFAFRVALMSYNVLGVVKGALRSVHGGGGGGGGLGVLPGRRNRGDTPEMMIAIPEDEWTVFAGLTPSVPGEVLKDLAAKVRLSTLRKHPRGPKRPQPKRQSGAKIKHVSTAKLLRSRKKRT